MRQYFARLLFPVWFAAFVFLPGLCLAKEEVPNNGQDVTRPLTRFDIRYQYQNLPLLESDHDDEHIVTLRMDRPFDLAPGWKLATRFDAPVMFSNRRSLDNTHGDTRFGLSDVLAQAILVNIPTERFAWAVGTQLVLPTATQDTMGSGTWRAVPTAAMRWDTGDLLKGSWVALAGRWDRSFADTRYDSTTVNELQFAPIVNIFLPDLWFINLFPSTDIRYNLGDMKDGDTGRWFVPANFMIGKMLDEDTVTSLEIGIPIIDDYHVYDFKMEFRMGFFF